eukprot:TRINITY_DN5851_c0_g1_i1.p1 TRINITY_DN5851_c0_g1~~TRINITY_DN5851_c0_g1_i1.p1  ORF type:complete len:113 (-),score=6.95 TRINITY_DN5851_c0_g1_i1:61-363(-)
MTRIKNSELSEVDIEIIRCDSHPYIAAKARCIDCGVRMCLDCECEIFAEKCVLSTCASCNKGRKKKEERCNNIAMIVIILFMLVAALGVWADVQKKRGRW